MTYKNLRDAYIGEGRNIIGKTVRDGSVEKRVESLKGTNIDLTAVLEGDKEISYSYFQYYECSGN